MGRFGLGTVQGTEPFPQFHLHPEVCTVKKRLQVSSDIVWTPTLALTPWTWAPREGQRWVQAGGACAVITLVPESPSPERPPRPGGLEQPSGRRPTCCGRESLSLLSFPFSYHLPPHSAFGAKAARSTQDTFFVLILCALPQQAGRGPRPQRLCRRPSWVAISHGSLSKIQQSRRGRSIHRRRGTGRVGRPQRESREVNED